MYAFNRRKIEEISAMSAYHRSLLAIFNGKKQDQVVALFYPRTFHSSGKPISILKELRAKYQKAQGKLFRNFVAPTSLGGLS